MPTATRARSGDYRHRIYILTNTKTKDSFGQEKHAWTPNGAAMWCAIEPEFRPTDIFVQTAAAHHYEQKLWFRTRTRHNIDRAVTRLRHTQPISSDAIIEQQGAPGIDAQQTIRITGAPTGGTFTLTYSGQTTAPIAFDATTVNLATALKALNNIGDTDITVTGIAGSPWIVTFQNTLGAQTIPLLTANASQLTPPNIEGAATPKVIIATTRIGGPANNASQMVSLTNVTGGSFTLTYNGQTTLPIIWNATTVTIATALKALNNIADPDITVTGADGGPWTITFQAGLGGQIIAPLTVATNNLLATAPTDYEILAIEDPSGHNRETRMLCREVLPL